MGDLDTLSWWVLAILALGTEITGMILVQQVAMSVKTNSAVAGADASAESCCNAMGMSLATSYCTESQASSSVGVFWGLGLGMFCLTMQVGLCVQAGFVADVELIKMLYKGDTIRTDGLDRNKGLVLLDEV